MTGLGSGEWLSFGEGDLPTNQFSGLHRRFGSLCYWTPRPLSDDVEIFGFPEVTASVRILNADEGCFVARLIDVFPKAEDEDEEDEEEQIHPRVAAAAQHGQALDVNGHKAMLITYGVQNLCRDEDGQIVQRIQGER